MFSFGGVGVGEYICHEVNPFYIANLCQGARLPIQFHHPLCGLTHHEK